MTAILEASGVVKNFGAVTAADNLSVQVAEEEVLGIIGANGAGKTTFVNIVTGYLKPDAGSIRYDGRDITALSSRAITRLGIHRSFQIPQIFPEITVFNNLMVALGIAETGRPGMWRALATRNRAETAQAILTRYGVEGYRDQRARVLPQGARKLLDIAMAMVGNPRIVLLDEPTSGISADEKFAVMDRIMSALREHKVTVLFVEHDMEVVERYAKRVLAFYDGRIIADGAPDMVLANPDVRTYVVGPELHRRAAPSHA